MLLLAGNNCEDLQELKKILVIRLSSFGDIILSFPLLRKLREKFPDSEIHYLTKSQYKDVVALNPDVNRIILFEAPLNKMRNGGKE